MNKSMPVPLQASQWQHALPYLALPLLIALLGTLVWLTRVHDEESRHAQLISDVLWLEQSLQFQLEHNAAQLAQLGPELVVADIASQTDARLRQLLRSDNGLVRIAWLDNQGRPLGALPPVAGDAIADAPQLLLDDDRVRLARSSGRAVYGPPYASPGGHQFEVYIPTFSDSGLLGVTVGVYSIERLLARELPWWFSERYRVSVLDSDGNEIATRSQVATRADAIGHTMSFDPPGHGLLLRITPYRDEARWIPALLIGSILVLGSLIVWSVWQLRLQLARRQAAEQALRGETLFRKAMEDSLMTGLRARDLDGRVTYVNPAFCRMVGYSAEELIGLTPPMPYWDPDNIERIQELHDRILSGHGPHEGFELRLRRKNGEILDAMIFEAPLIDADGRHTGWMGSMLDITERKRARELARQQEERLQATSRLVTMGEMASTLAHELNQPLTAITTYNSGCLNLLAEDQADPAELREVHERIARQAYRAAEIIRRVHDFVRRSEPKREVLDIDALIRDALALLEPDMRKRQMRVVTGLSGVLPRVKADPVMIEQVIVNLVRNGMDAMDKLPREARVITLSTAVDHDHVVIRIADRGPGIAPELQRRLFEPFFTTKPEGMGMGLNICRSIAELHHGRLGFEAAAEGGTVFTLTLPVEPSDA